jgi:hypothetical protein
MNWVYLISVGWLLHCALAGGLLLLVVYGWMRRTAQPVRQQRLGVWGLTAALLVAVLSLCPAWLVIPIHLAPSREAPATTQAEASPPTRGIPKNLPRPNPVSDPGTTDLPREGEKGEGIPLDIHRWRLTMPNHEKDSSAIVPAAPPTGPLTGSAEPSAREEPSETRGVGAPVPGLSSWSLSSGFPVGLRLLAPVGRWLGLAWASAAVVLLGRWLLGHLLLWRLIARAEPPPEAVARLLDDMTRGRPRPRLLVSRRLHVPLSCGLWRPTIVLPAALSEPTAALRWVLAHELTHLERRDVWTCLLFGLGQVVYFYLPWFWWLRRQVGLCQEYLADAAVADQEARPEEYAEFLVSLTTGPAAPAVATGVSGRPSDLFRRVSMLLETPLRLEKRCPRLWSWAVAGGLSLTAILLAGVGLTAAPVGGIADRGSRIADRTPKSESPGSAPEEKAAPRSAILNPRSATPGMAVRPPDGVMAEQLDLPADTGLVVERVEPSSPAARAGLREHDLLLALAGHAISRSPADLTRLLEQIQPGVAVEVRVLRKGKPETIRGLVLPPADPPPTPAPQAPLPLSGVNLVDRVSGGATVMTTLAWVEDHFTTRHQEGTLSITISGTRAGSQLRVEGIEVVDGAVALHFDEASAVPARYGDKVRSLLEWGAAADPLQLSPARPR